MARWTALAMAMLAGAAAASPPARFELPITAVTLSDGVIRYSIPITIGGVQMAGGLDTGSTGLRVVAPAVPDAASARGPSSSYSYSGGVKIDGTLVSLPVAIGGVAAKVPVQRIDTVGCIAQKPQCPAQGTAIADFRIQGDGLKGEGFSAIVGLSMGRSDAPNPLIALGATRWIVELPRPGDTTPGRLIVEPSDEEVAGFARIALMPALADRRGGVHDGMAGCLIRADTRAKLCGPILLDTGAPGIRVSLADAALWPRGTAGLLVIGDGNGQQQMDFIAGRRDQASGMFMEQPAPGTTPRISVGMMPYYRWAVLYDAKAQAIGLKPR